LFIFSREGLSGGTSTTVGRKFSGDATCVLWHNNGVLDAGYVEASDWVQSNN